VLSGWNGGYGNCVIIDHRNGLWTVYGHFSRLYVSQGQTVYQGQALGIEGTTGNSTGPHLHFEVRVGSNLYNNAVNPLRYLR
jgi:murein DD-endopeptidase MepM/ murein hydrolase activator NlpD